MSKIWSKFSAMFRNRTFIGADKTGNQYYVRTEQIDGIMKEKRQVEFKGEVDSTSIPVEWICWLNGQRKIAPTPEEMAMLEARRQRVKENVAMKEKRQVEFKGEVDSTSIPVEWICWLNGQRKIAPTPEEMAMLEARRQRVKENVAILKKEEEERKTREGSSRKITSMGKGDRPDLKSFIQQLPVDSEGDKSKEVSEATSSKWSTKKQEVHDQAKQEPQSTEPTELGASFRPGTWQPRT